MGAYKSSWDLPPIAGNLAKQVAMIMPNLHLWGSPSGSF
jgi:hypothetical protein